MCELDGLKKPSSRFNKLTLGYFAFFIVIRNFSGYYKYLGNPMNFLAHIYLSESFDDLMVGNFIGDFVKGKQFETYNREMVKGIRIHREIDWYTDNHEIVDLSKDRLWKNYRHYSSVIVDIFYDHFLAKDWHKYSDVPLETFTDQAYKSVLKREDILPEKVKEMMSFMVKDNWLASYAKVEGIEKVLKGMSLRTKFQSNMEKSVKDLIRHYETFNEEFHVFFPQILSHIREFRKSL